MPAVIQVKRGTASSWTSANTILAAGEIGFETDTRKFKVGDGSTAWSSLSYSTVDFSSVALTGTPTAPTAAANTNTTQIATTAYVQTEINDLIAAAPGALDTLNELASALGNDANFATTVTNSLTARATLTGAETLTNKTLTAPILTNAVITQPLVTPTFSANAYTLVLGDQGDILLASNGSTAGTINVPTNASVAFPVGTQITIIQTGSGQLTIQAVTSGTTTIASTGATATAPKLRAQNSSATLIKTATDTWYVVGDIA